jgi:hypothetical protein
VRISTAALFDGKLLVRGGKSALDRYDTDNIDSQDFAEGTLTMPAEAFPFSLIRPPISTQETDGPWINCQVRIPEHGDVTITGIPFNGGSTLLLGIRTLLSHTLEILNPAGMLMPREPRLHFHGDVAVSDDLTAGKTVVRAFAVPDPWNPRET